jgi:uncharacterized membrane protein YhfC
MQKDTKTYKCDGCDKTKVFDYYDSADAVKMANVEKEIANWITIRLSARRAAKDATPIVDTVGHACSEDCVKKAIANIVKRKIQE